MELTSNAIFAAAGYLLGRRTGLSRKDMLEAIGTSTVWPDLSRRKTPLSSFEPVYSIEKAFGLSVPEWLSMSLKARILSLGLSPDKSWVRIKVHCDTECQHFNVQVRSEYPALEADVAEVRCRFESTGTTSERILNERKPFEDEDGIYHMPSFTGGGGMGLLECIRLSAENNLYLKYETRNGPEPLIYFNLGNHPAE